MIENKASEEKIIINRGYFKHKIRSFLECNSYSDFHDAIAKNVIGQENLKYITIEIYSYLERISRGLQNPNPGIILLCAPSGSGKTQTYRSLKTFINNDENLNWLPCYSFNLADVTENGYKGKNASEIIDPLLEQRTKGVGIVILDEFDKKIVPSIVNSGENWNIKVQHALLAMLEGTVIRGEDKMGRSTEIDTSNTLFIGLGSFDFVREDKKQKANKHTLGFIEDENVSQVYEHYDDISKEDLIKSGGIYEMVSRIVKIVNYHKPDEDSIKKIINKMLNDEGNNINYAVDADESTIRKLFEISNSKSELGFRVLKGEIHNRAIELYLAIKKYDIPNVRQLVLSEEGDYIELYTEEIIRPHTKSNVIEKYG